MTGPCPCHTSLGEAIEGHAHLTYSLAARLGLHPGDVDWDDAISDGMLALWQALESYDPTRWDFERYLPLRVRHRMIDGIRKRSGRGQDRPLFVSLDALDSDVRDCLTLAPANLTATAEGRDLVRMLAQLDPRLPGIALLIAAGFTRTEAGALHGLSRARIWQLLTLANQAHRAA
jgi:RNA polymerase sigma factor (sigma-70 family)